MEAILKTPEETRVKINTSTDLCLYDSPSNPPNTGTTYTRGTDLYMHTARSGKHYFYTHYWSMWQGESDSLNLITEDEAKKFVIEKAALTRFGITIGDVDVLSVWPDIFEETA